MTNYLGNSNIFANFGAWIGGSCKPSDKGKLTALPHFKFCQHNFKNVSNMLKYEELPEVNSERWLSLEDFEGEEWRDVKGYEKRLSISNYGRLKRKSFDVYHPKTDSYTTYKEMILKVKKNHRGYYIISRNLLEKNINKSIHRLAAETFIPNIDNLEFVNHKDENKENNTISNLEWCTPKYNSNYGQAREKMKKTIKERGRSKSVILYSYEGEVVKEYNTMMEAAIDNNVTNTSVADCCLGKTSASHGLHFRFKGDIYIKREIKINVHFYKVDNGKSVEKYRGTTAFCNRYKIDIQRFQRFLQKSSGYINELSGLVVEITTSVGKKYIIINGKLEV